MLFKKQMKSTGYRYNGSLRCMVAVSLTVLLLLRCTIPGKDPATIALYNKAKDFYEKKKYPQAFQLYKKAAEAGHPEAMNEIGWMYEKGEAVATDYTKALQWYTKAAEAGNAAAMSNIGWIYDKGEGVKEDNVKAVEWYRKAIDEGNTTARYNLAWMYENGEGVQLDYKKAMELYVKAAAEESGDAMNNIGWMYENGEGVAVDYKKAMEWYQKAAATMFRMRCIILDTCMKKAKACLLIIKKQWNGTRKRSNRAIPVP